MGAWGLEPFDNDDAADWSHLFDGVNGSAGLEILRNALEAVDAIEYIEAPDGAAALAAAQVVVWALHPGTVQESPYNESVIAWLRTGAVSIDASLIDAARRALARVRSPESELAELWEEPDDAEWQRVVDRIDSQMHSDS